MKTITVEALADVHTHLREGPVTKDIIYHLVAGGADVFGAMPNTVDPLTTAEKVIAYVERSKAVAVFGKHKFSIIPFVMITEKTVEKDIDDCIKAGIRDAKIYPLMRTTQSESGVSRYGKILLIIRYCGKVGMKCHFHPEHPSMLYSSRDAEYAFLPLVRMFLEESDTTIIWEHGTDAHCIPHWEDMASSQRFSVTLTAHHLATNEDKAFGDVSTVCKPPIKLESDRIGLIGLVTKNHDWVMAGSDVAFHDIADKHPPEGCCKCGAYTGPFLLPLYAHALEKLLDTAQGVETFKNFTSRNARKFHELPSSSCSITLAQEPWKIPLTYSVGPKTALPFWSGKTLNWRIV